MKCPDLPEVQNGWYLTKATIFHFNNIVPTSVDIHCADGYFFASDGTPTSSTDGTIECGNDATWDKMPSCSGKYH